VGERRRAATQGQGRRRVRWRNGSRLGERAAAGWSWAISFGELRGEFRALDGVPLRVM
jgi:hypothetical protein